MDLARHRYSDPEVRSATRRPRLALEAALSPASKSKAKQLPRPLCSQCRRIVALFRLRIAAQRRNGIVAPERREIVLDLELTQPHISQKQLLR